MTLPTDAQQISAWIIRGIVAIAVALIIAGVVLFDFATGTDTPLPFTTEIPTLPQGSPNGQTNTVSRGGFIEDATPIPWQDYLPTGNEIVEETLRKVEQTAIGPPDARVTVIEYGTYGCQSCRRLEQNGFLESLFNQYGDDMRFVFVNWPVIHTNDSLAAAAALCALDQGTQVYWDFHNALFDLTDEQFSRYSHYQRFTSLAESIDNLDSAQFATCMVDDKYQAFVFELVQAGMELHLSGTPTFFVNGKMTYVDDLESMIESAINHRHP